MARGVLHSYPAISRRLALEHTVQVSLRSMDRSLDVIRVGEHRAGSGTGPARRQQPMGRVEIAIPGP